MNKEIHIIRRISFIIRINFIKIFRKNEEECITAPVSFEVPKQKVYVEIPFCPSNEEAIKHFIKKVHDFTNDKISIVIKWSTKKVKSLFKLKDKNPYPACVIYEGECSCDSKYIGETHRNARVRWNEHENINKDSEPAKHLKDNLTHSFIWKILLPASLNFRQRKNLKASQIALKRPNLNNQVDTKTLILFTNGVT